MKRNDWKIGVNAWKNASEKKEWRDNKTSKESLKSSKAFDISRWSKQQRRKYSSQKKNHKGESITSRKGIADVFGEFYRRLYEDNEKDDSEHEVNDDGDYSNTDVHNNDTEETAGIPDNDGRVANRNQQTQKKANPRTTKEFDPKTLKIVMGRREKCWDKSSTRSWREGIHAWRLEESDDKSDTQPETRRGECE